MTDSCIIIPCYNESNRLNIEAYKTFQKQLESCVADMERFNKEGQKYAEFLREKAALANKYLNRRSLTPRRKLRNALLSQNLIKEPVH